MIRGTTPTHIFTLSIDSSYLKNIRITYAQDDKIILQKEIEDCETDGFAVKVTLTQEETLMFNCKKLVQIQVRALTYSGEALACPVMQTTVGKCLDSEVLA